MILTVTPNAAVDKTYRIEAFRLDHVNRPSQTYTVAGGKGINVARVYQTLGGKAVATGFLGGRNGQILADALKVEAITDACVRVKGETRFCIAVIDPTTGTQTEINESGPVLSRNAENTLRRRVRQMLTEQPFTFLVLSGSLPPGTSPNLYADLIRIAHKSNIRAVLDTSGEALAQGIAVAPWMIKPNRLELETLFERPIETLEAAQEQMRKCAEQGVSVVAYTMGAEGALLLHEGQILRSVPPTIEFASAVASGDSFLAAFLWEWEQGAKPGEPEEALRLGTGAGSANAAVIGAGFCSRESIYALAGQTQIRF